MRVNVCYFSQIIVLHEIKYNCNISLVLFFFCVVQEQIFGEVKILSLIFSCVPNISTKNYYNPLIRLQAAIDHAGVPFSDTVY